MTQHPARRSGAHSSNLPHRPFGGGAENADHAPDQLLNSGTVELDRTGVDRYGRTLARVLVNGQDITEAMIGAGHARRYQRGQQAWC